MQLKQVAELLGVENKELMSEIEAHREDYSSKGFKIAKKLTAASALDEQLVRHVLADFDVRRQKVVAAEKQDKDRRHREEEERRRAAEELQRKKEEEERRAKAEEARLKAEAELARKQAEVRAAEEAHRAEAHRRAQEEAAAAKQAAEESAKAAKVEKVAEAPKAKPAAEPEPPAAPVAAAPAPTEPPAAPPRPLAPVSPSTIHPGNRPAHVQTPPRAPNAPSSFAPANFMPRPSAPSAPRAPMQRPGGPGGERGPRPSGDRPPRTGAPTDRPDFRQRQGGPGGDRPPRTGAPGERQDFRPRPQGPGGPGGDRGPRPGNYEQRGPRPAGDRGPRPGGPGGDRGPRPGGGYEQRGPRPGGGPNPRDGRGGDQGAGRPAKTANVRSFIETGIGTDISGGDEFRRQNQRRPAGKPAKAATPGTDREKEGAAKAKRPGKLGDTLGKKKIRPTQVFGEALGDNRRSGYKPRKKGSGRGNEEQVVERPKVVKFNGDFTVGEFSEKTGIAIGDVMKKLLLMGEMLTINQLLDPDKAEELALEFEVEISIEREGDEFDVAEFSSEADNEEDLVPRAPVVTVMGHVDHGKTSLLDRIRKADVASGEHGGITQHIGAYLVATQKGNVVFLDTPGHEAFTEMRSRGANVTDLVVLVVAANDGVMPQTVEAINHAKAAEVPIIVAINKIDIPGANPERVKQELMKYELVPEEYGGETIMIPVSAKVGDGIENLLEYIALQTEILELKANPNRSAEGTVIESHVDPLRGAVATVLVERGTLRVGDAFLCGTEYGRIRAMRDDRDHMVEEAGPSTPVEILGLSGSPTAGERLYVLPSESEAREIAERRAARRKTRRAIVKQHVSLDNLAERMNEAGTLTLNVIVKADVQGSVEAINNALLKIKSDKVLVKILHSAVGAVSVSDVQLADASDSIILAFNVGQDPAAKSLAEEDGVDVRSYQIIYALLEDMEKAMVGLLAPEFEEKDEGRARVQQTFKVSKVGTVAGCFVEEGVVAADHHARLLRNGAIIWRGKLKSLRRVKDAVKQVLSGVECGIGLENFNDVKEGDIIETYSLVQKAVTLVSAGSEKN